MTRGMWTGRGPADAPAPVTSQELRRATAGMFAGASAFEPFPGVIAGLSVSVDAGDVWSTTDGTVLLPGVSGGGPYLAGPPAASGALAVRDATSPRADRLIARQYDDPAAGNVQVVVEALTGAPSAGTPVMPALPQRAVHLAKLDVPPLDGGNVSVDTSERLYATGLGGVLPVGNAGLLPATGGRAGQRARALDTGYEHVWTGAAWQVTDTGWVSLGAPLSASFGLPGGQTNQPHIRRADGWGILRGYISRASGAFGNGGTWQHLYTIDPEFRPLSIEGGDCHVGFYEGADVTPGSRVTCTIDAVDGHIEIANIGSVSLDAGTLIGFTFAWRVDF